MSPVQKRWILGGGALAAVAIVVVAAAVLLWRGSSTPGAAPKGEGPGSSQSVVESPAKAATTYLKSFADNYAADAAVVTDDPPATTAALIEVRAALKPTKVEAALTQVAPTAGEAAKTSGMFRVSWTFGPGRVWSYDNNLELVRSGQKWLVHWTPALLNPKLEAGQRLALGTVSDQPGVVDRDGKPLVSSALQPAEGNPAPLLQGGLSKIAQEHVSPNDTFSIALLDGAGKQVETLFGGKGGSPAKSLTSSLSLGVQAAAQAAVDTAGKSAMIVAISQSTGDILAVAQNTAAGNQPKALSGLYAPGSTFKIVTAAAALQQGDVTADTVLPCPGTDHIGQRTIPNDNNFELPPQPLHGAFAHSCNTTFARLAAGLPADALKRAADQFGLNADFDIPGITTEAGKVETPGSPAEQTDAGIGQGKVLVSPFGAALMVATVAAGRAVTPKLWHGIDTTVATGYKTPGSVIGSLRSMMREVVTGGTATGLNRSGQVFGKTGTAQLPDPSQANGWFAGYRGDVAFAVMIEFSNSSRPAVEMAAKFLSGVH
jgi:beta-lactamase class D